MNSRPHPDRDIDTSFGEHRGRKLAEFRQNGAVAVADTAVSKAIVMRLEPAWGA